MTPERWGRIKEVFGAALGERTGERSAVLDAMCAGDAELRAELERLLAETSESSLPSPVEGALTQAGAQPARAGQIVNSYLILRRIGAGGMSVVYKALDIRLGRPVALKFLPSELDLDEDARTALVNEAKTAAALNHPNIESVHGMEETAGGQLFIVMAYYEGETLAEKMQRGPLPVADAAAIAVQIANGLAEAHAHKVVHRDIKPSNIVLTRQGVAKIVDFGIARIIHSVNSTRSMHLAGTAAYMSPEQAKGQGLDARTDLWSLGAVLYEMIAGRPPFEGADLPAKLFAIVNASPPDLSREVPAAMQKVVYRALAKDPGDRYQSAALMIADLRWTSAQTGQEQDSTATLEELKKHTRPARPQGSRRHLGWILAALLAAVVAVLWWILWPAGPKPAAYQSYLKALDYMQRYEKPENLDRAISLLRESVKADPKFALAFASLGQACWQKARLTADPRLLREAETHARHALELNGNLARVHIVMGLIQRSLGNLELAEEEFERALKMEPSDADSLAGLAGVYQAQRRLKEAEDLYRRAATLHPESWETHNNLGVFLLTQNRYREAAQQFSRVIELAPGNVVAYLNLGAALMDDGQLDEAEKVLERAREKRPTSYTAAAVYTNLGSIYGLKRRFREAEAATRQALKFNARDWITWRNLAVIERWLGDDAAAVTAYKSALPLLETVAAASPQDPALQSSLAEIYAYCGERVKSEERLRTALALAPENHTVLLSAAKAYAALGDRDRAVALANDAVRNGLTLAELDQEPEGRWLGRDSRFTLPSK